jgi:hypothetical protein
MGISNETSCAMRLAHLRAGVRVNSRMKVRVEWSEKGELHSVEGYTVDISPKGCLAIVPQGFAVGQRMKLTNSINGRESEATLIWRGHEGGRGWELGLELVNAPEEFWGLEF